MRFGESMKIASTTAAIWLLCTIGIAYWYVVIDSGRPPVSEEYEQWKDLPIRFLRCDNAQTITALIRTDDCL
ncbi:MAG: hypothetical protein DMD81_16980 [Candidatus Rokuibacteriota bacterium]|nr:MAG: hypothetical protein DMD81_16980 [Candidatus Rokubacteria bacterium]